jgi:hypothetical protein
MGGGGDATGRESATQFAKPNYAEGEDATRAHPNANMKILRLA